MRVHKKWVKPETIFLGLAMIFGLAYAFLQPLFVESDSSFHFDYSAYIGHTVVDRASVGMPAEDYQSQPVAFMTVSQMKRDGTYYKNFFQTKLPRISRDKVVDKRVTLGSENSVVSHIIPSIGVALGYILSPTIGSMVITARVCSLLFFSISLYGIIKHLKAYKGIFAAISLTPTVIQHATSLSYDCYNYVASAFMIMVAINSVITIQQEKEVRLGRVLFQFVAPAILLFFAKKNAYLLYLMIPVILLYLWAKKTGVTWTKKQMYLCIAVGSVGLLGVLAVVIGDVSHFIWALKRFFYTTLEPYYTVWTTEVIGGTTTAGLPAWFFPIQILVLVLLYLSYRQEEVPRWFAWFGLALVLVNGVFIMVKYAINPNFIDYSGRIITGPQGRYFTPYLLLLAPSMTLLSRKITVTATKSLYRLVVAVTVLALCLNLTEIYTRFYRLQLPADEYRSGIEHYIFK